YKVFLNSAVGGNWDKAAAIAKANGHTLEIFKGKDASIANFNAAAADHNNRVVVVGHTSHEMTEHGIGKTTAVMLGNGRSAGMNSEAYVEDATNTIQPVPLLPTFVSADTVAARKCNCVTLSAL